MAAEFSLEDGVVPVFYVPSNTPVTVLPQGTPISGTDGTDGTDGNTILGGSGAPSALLGVDGDYYIDSGSSDRNMYGPKTAGAWGSAYALKGPAGTSTSSIHFFFYAGW